METSHRPFNRLTRRVMPRWLLVNDFVTILPREHPARKRAPLQVVGVGGSCQAPRTTGYPRVAPY